MILQRIIKHQDLIILLKHKQTPQQTQIKHLLETFLTLQTVITQLLVLIKLQIILEIVLLTLQALITQRLLLIQLQIKLGIIILILQVHKIHL